MHLIFLHHGRLRLALIVLVALLFSVGQPVIGLDDAIGIALDIQSSCTYNN